MHLSHRNIGSQLFEKFHGCAQHLWLGGSGLFHLFIFSNESVTMNSIIGRTIHRYFIYSFASIGIALKMNSSRFLEISFLPTSGSLRSG